jgi:hypothetical protein
MVTRANRRFHLIKLLFSCSFVAIFLCAAVKKKPEKSGAAAVANILRLKFRRHDMEFEIHHELLSRMPES